VCSFLKRTDQGEKPLSEHLARLNSLVKREIKVRFLSTLLNINNMIITVKVNNENICVSDFYLMLMEKQISNVEFEKLVFERTGKKLIRQFS
jgi:hypothetical protein